MFTGWKNERCIVNCDNGRIILVRSGDPKRHWDKVESVLEVSFRELNLKVILDFFVDRASYCH
jgi:hypothetical protein